MTTSSLILAFIYVIFTKHCHFHICFSCLVHDYNGKNDRTCRFFFSKILPYKTSDYRTCMIDIIRLGTLVASSLSYHCLEPLMGGKEKYRNHEIQSRFTQSFALLLDIIIIWFDRYDIIVLIF